ncbi:thermonuclease family protein [Methylobacterium planeticum]|uniref:thermonuclease family protein n=1 Tax=Methylobacterium planeticum TaxID=2615211 RepID=UPI001FEE91FC|nr:thermonuclease family protein [Methylobacterium planeticum]
MILRSATLLLLLSFPAVAAEAVSGPATVIDGDTIELHGSRIRLYGIDAPETAQNCENAAGHAYPCGRDAAHALAEQIGSNPVTCEPLKAPKSERVVAVCRVGHEDLSAWMAAHGHAVADRRTSATYVRQESKAWAMRRGLWAGIFVDPADWRRTSRRSEATAKPPAQD